MYIITNGNKFWTCSTKTDVGRIIGCSYDTVKKNINIAIEDAKTVFRYKEFFVGFEHTNIKTQRGFALKKIKNGGFKKN